MGKCFRIHIPDFLPYFLAPVVPMKPLSTSALVLLQLIRITVVAVFEAQEVKVQQEVTGYVGHDVTLPCKFISGPKNDQVTQVQWGLKQAEGKETVIIVFNDKYGIKASDTFLKDKVAIAEHSLLIRDVDKRDGGLYICTITTFPGGSFRGSTNLVVQDQMPLSSGVISAVVIAVLLLVLVMVVIAYFILIRRPDSSGRHCVYIDTSGPTIDMTKPDVTVRDEDVVYSDVELKPPRDATPSSNNKHIGTTKADDVIYSKVLVFHP